MLLLLLGIRYWRKISPFRKFSDKTTATKVASAAIVAPQVLVAIIVLNPALFEALFYVFIAIFVYSFLLFSSASYGMRQAET